MAVLTDEQRQQVWAEIMRELSSRGINPNITKPQGRTIVDALDLFLSDNQAAINQSIPQPERGLAPVDVKAVIFRALVAVRYIEGVN